MKRLARWLLLALLALLLVPARVSAQGVRHDDISLNPRGGPLVAKVAVCNPSGLSTTGASVSSNLATLTMASNPQTAGFVLNSSITVSGFSGSDTYFNGTFTISAVSATQISYALTHANATASSNGAVVQAVGTFGSCAPFSPVYSDQALTQPLSQPFQTDNAGNYGFWSAPGTFTIAFNGPGVTPTSGPLSIPCAPGSTCGGSVTSFSAGNLFSLFTTSVATPTTTPALSFALNTQGANQIFGGPSSGPAAAPTFRSLVAADIPAGNSCAANNFANALNAALSLGCAQVNFSNLAGTIASAQFGSQTANTVLAAPNGAAGNPTFRALVPADYPVFGPSGASHSAGAVPDPGATAGTTRFLREDATFAVPSSGGPTTAYLTSSYTNATTTFSNVTGLSFSVAANTKYKVACDLDFQSSTTAIGINVQWTGPASPTAVTYDGVIWNASTSADVQAATAFSTVLGGSLISAANLNFPMRTTMTLQNGPNAGTIQLQAKATGTGTITIIPGSCSLQQ